MSQTKQLISELKRQLKLHGKSYKDVAQVLELSEASVKRLLTSGNSLTLDRLESICTMMSIELDELFAHFSSRDTRISSLTMEQEKMVVSDPILLLIAVCTHNGYTFEDITSQYKLPEHTLIQKLALLDKIKLIELLPGNKIKLMVSPNFKWLPGGPIQTYFQQWVRDEFFRSFFTKEGEKLSMATGLLSLHSTPRLHKLMDKLVAEFYDACRDDSTLPMDKRHGTSLVVAIRPWQFSQFEDIADKE
ncbi:helix-turn-helix domain-containing protein [Vibrio sp. RC27]